MLKTWIVIAGLVGTLLFSARDSHAQSLSTIDNISTYAGYVFVDVTIWPGKTVVLQLGLDNDNGGTAWFDVLTLTLVNPFPEQWLYIYPITAPMAMFRIEEF